jgi:hypothetical protein
MTYCMPMDKNLFLRDFKKNKNVDLTKRKPTLSSQKQVPRERAST